MSNEDRILDWVPRFDEKSLEYPVKPTLRQSFRPRDKTWKIGPVLDQGYEGACVGFGWAAEALSTPVAVQLNKMRFKIASEPDDFARTLYRLAQKIDEWEGEDYSGTSVLAGAKAMNSLRLIREYRWAFTIDDVIASVLSKGPVVVGTEWRDGMYDAPNGLLTPSGRVVGGHCYTIVGYRVKHPLLNGEDGLVVQNSWGTSWGNDGLAVISLTDMESLLANHGEACVPTKRSFGWV